MLLYGNYNALKSANTPYCRNSAALASVMYCLFFRTCHDGLSDNILCEHIMNVCHSLPLFTVLIDTKQKKIFTFI